MLRSVLPGRIRARLPIELPEDKLAALRAALEKAGASMVHNPRSGGLLVTWNPGPKRDQAVRKALDAQVKPGAACPTKAGWPTMKTVKQGMAVSLGVALAALAVRSERAHMWAGGAFAALLSRHLYVYRKRLFK
jgi:hypothetical protein